MEAHCIKKDNHDYPFFEIMELYQAPGSPDMILKRAVDEIPGIFLAHGKVSSRIIWKNRFFDSPDFDKKGRRLTSEIVVNGNRDGVIEVYFNKVQTEIGKWDMPSFPSRNSNLLLDRISKFIGSLLEKDSLINLLTESEANMRNILDRLQEHIFVLDSRGNILDCNRSSMDCLNFGCNQIAGFRLADTGFLDPQTIDEIIENTLLSGRFSLEIECHCPDETTTVWIDSCCMDYNKEQAVLCIIRDISKSREYEDELKKQAEDLKSSGELKELFIDIIRHDLLTPAGIIKGFTEELLLGPSEEEKYMAIRKIYENTNRLIELLDSATKLSKLQKVEEIPFQSMDLVPFFLMVAESLHIQVQERRQQALEYTHMMDLPFAFSSNGDAFLFHDRSGNSTNVEKELSLDSFPTPDELWESYCKWKGIDTAKPSLVDQDYYTDFTGKVPRYYQLNAINKTIEAIAKGQNRILLVMATGTGKTYTAFQIIWRLWKSKAKKRILFLADRNILVDQAKTNDFKPFEGAMTKIQNRQVDKSYEIYLSLYQAVSGSEEEKNIYKQFSRDFFDLVVVDECHRGSADENSAWRDILEYFDSATQIGMTATPKETKDVSNIEYFGDPIYTYSLKQGIEDGFLAPYKVIRIDLDKDLQGWRPEKGQLDRYGREIEDRIYNQKDFDREVVLEKRTEIVAKKVTEFLKATNRYDKTIVFCENIDHAERMRQAIANENPDLAADSKYVMRITGDEQEGKAELDNFIMPDSRYPVIATTSKLLSTGVDVQTCKLIVLDKRIKSMTEFKQIIGRGTRINEEFDKLFFTIIDFKKATELFADPDFDGEPVDVYEGKGSIKLKPNLPRQKIKPYRVSDVGVSIVAERVQYYGADGKLITESIKDYTRKTLLDEFDSLDLFLQYWSEHGKKTAIVQELEDKGLLLDALAEEVGREYDPFDLICHVVFDQPPLSRRERANNVRKNGYFEKYGDKARAVLDALLEKYADEGIRNLEDLDILRVKPLSEIGTPMEIIKLFGGKQKFMDAVNEIETQLYMAEA